MAINIGAAKRGFLYNPASKSLGIYVDGVKVADYASTVGRTYYVNNITGSSGADGLSWGSAVDQINAAIVLSEAYRTLGGDPGGRADTRNDYVRNTIIVQGTCQITTAYTAADYYDALTDLGQHVNIVGLGDHFVGMDKGTVIIGAINGNADGIADAGTTRGVNMFNLMVGADGSASNALDVQNMFRCRLEDCWFGQHTQTTQAEQINAGIECDGSFAHNLIRHCVIGQTNGAYSPVYGMDIANSGPDNSNLIEDNLILGTTTGILCTKTANWLGTCIRNNVIAGLTGQCSGTGITGGLYTTIAGNYISAADAIDAATTGLVIGNIVNEGGTGKTETRYAAQAN